MDPTEGVDAVRVLLIGVTGVLGREAAPRLLAAGHEVTGLARNAERAAAIARLGVEPVIADLFDLDSMSKALDGRAAVVNLATRIPTGAKAAMTGGWAENNRIRTEGSRVLVEAALRTDDVRVIVQEGISFGYADGGDTELTEDAPIVTAGPLRSAEDAHANVARFAAAGRVGVRLRIGGLIGDEPLARTLLRTARLRGPVAFGDPSGWMTVIRPADAAAAAVAAMGAPSGVYNVGANPLRKAEFAASVAEAAGVRKGRVLPKLLAVGPLEILARSQRVTSAKLTTTTGWRPEQPDLSASWFPGPANTSK
ncbi:MAG: NAD-dependent epimerase/dehydratase family protein [Labedaea sp.]